MGLWPGVLGVSLVLAHGMVLFWMGTALEMAPPQPLLHRVSVTFWAKIGYMFGF